MVKRISIRRAELKGIVKDYLASYEMESECLEKVPIAFMEWFRGKNKWEETEVIIRRKHFDLYKYYITDERMDGKAFIDMLNEIAKELGLNAKVDGEKLYSGEWRFNSIILFGEPCDEFKTLAEYAREKANFELEVDTMWTEKVVGKRNVWSGWNRGYLAYQPKYCREILDNVKALVADGNVLRMWFEEVLTHDDESDYNLAMLNEDEWYGTLSNKLKVAVKTTDGRVKAYKEFDCACGK